MGNFKDKLKPKDQPRSRDQIQVEYNMVSAQMGDLYNQVRKIPGKIQELEKIQDRLEGEMLLANQLAQAEVEAIQEPPLVVVPSEPEPTTAA